MTVGDKPNTDAIKDSQLDEDIADVLIAISVVSKRIANKIQALIKKEE